MYLHQKKNYKYKHLISTNDIDDIFKKVLIINYICFDTETTGLNIIIDKPFLVSFGFNESVYTFDYDINLFNRFISWVIKYNVPLFAHNAKYDYHMVENGGSPIPEEVVLYDSITVARLTENADERESMSLEALGTKYIDNEAKFAGHIIKDIIHKLDRDKREKLRKGIMSEFPDNGFMTKTKDGKIKGTGKLTSLLADYEKYRTKWVNDDDMYYKYIDANLVRSNYKDVYDKEPDLMRNYAADDIVIMNEYLKKSLQVLEEVDKGFRVLKREGKLIRAVAWMEKTGFKVNVDYILECRKAIVEYRNLLYSELMIYTGKDFSVGQHDYIKRLLFNQFGVKCDKADEKSLKYIINNTDNDTLKIICNNILELRTIDKWLSTYIDGKLNAIIYHKDTDTYRIHTDINNNGAVSGRVSCDMQQQPKDGLYDRDGKELFHPRSMFVCDNGYKLFFIDRH